ncbi:hypothetical protein LIER_03219 [Lithospermum erythrorhizon]|uniref:AN1-type domain-containing protein n=1 Tax=Lithospermum erythrorhizon TaxID=34254 RepID=A0AAV3NSC8_LITER
MAQQRETKDSKLKLQETLSSCTLQLSPPPLSPSTTTTTTTTTESTPLTKSTLSSDSIFLHENKLKRREKELNRCRCNGCNKKLGLMGFRCRCGQMFCPKHRYSDRHGCSFDYKAAGKEAIARENPLVRAAKLVKV